MFKWQNVLMFFCNSNALIQRLVLMLSGEFARWMILANLIAWPLAERFCLPDRDRHLTVSLFCPADISGYRTDPGVSCDQVSHNQTDRFHTIRVDNSAGSRW